jgi:predicted nucleic-acid-binding protein
MATSADIGLDTSVVLRLLVGEPSAQAEAAAEAVSRARMDGAAVIVSDAVVMETYFALQAAYRVPKKAALTALARMFDSGDVQPEPGGCARDAVNESLKSSSQPGFADRMIHARYRGHGAKLMTFEKASAKMPGVELLQ